MLTGWRCNSRKREKGDSNQFDTPNCQCAQWQKLLFVCKQRQLRFLGCTEAAAVQQQGLSVLDKGVMVMILVITGVHRRGDEGDGEKESASSATSDFFLFLMQQQSGVCFHSSPLLRPLQWKSAAADHMFWFFADLLICTKKH